MIVGLVAVMVVLAVQCSGVIGSAVVNGASPGLSNSLRRHSVREGNFQHVNFVLMLPR